MANHGLNGIKRIAALAAAAGLAGAAWAQPGSGDPDVIVGDLSGISNYGTNSSGTPNDTWIYAYSVGTTSCNIAGNYNTIPAANVSANDLIWVDSTNRHPVIGQNFYRLKVTDGTVGGPTRLEQIGMSWLKHGFTALTQNLCSPCGGRGGSVLGVGCSDPYVSSLNGQQGNLGPRSHVNATTGVFPYPFTNPGAGYIVPPAATNIIGRRLQVRRVDINPAQNPNCVYFCEGQYVEQDDSPNRTRTRNDPGWHAGPLDPNNYRASVNNASYRRITISNNATFSATVADSTKRTLPAIYAWLDYGGRNVAGNFNNTSDPTVQIVPVDVPDDGRFYVACRVHNMGNGVWRYEYAVENMHSHRSGGGFSVPLGTGAIATNQGFRDVEYHSGEPYDNSDWNKNASGGVATWVSPQTFAENANSNALRWGTMYNYWFDANTAPVPGDVTITLFKPGTPTSVTATVQVPGDLPCPACIADYNNSGGTPDDADVTAFFAAWSNGDPCADANGSGGTPDDVDVTTFFNLWDQGGC